MKTKLFPYKIYAAAPLTLSVIGIVASLYLALSHYRNYTDATYSSFCAISQALNCDTVSQSSWSILFGIPIALWGVLAYTLFFVICIAAQKNILERRYVWDLLFCLSIMYIAIDVYFAYIAVMKIKAYCIVCILTYGVSLGLFLSTYMIRKRFTTHSFFKGVKNSFLFLRKKKSFSLVIVCIIVLFSSLWMVLPPYWHFEYPPLVTTIKTGMTEDGRPWIGAEHPKLVINEFSDYQCFQCSKMHLLLRRLINEHPDSIRLVHYHYPLDDQFNTVLVKKPFHTGSGALALLAIGAVEQNRFWQTNDELYAIARQGLKEMNIVEFAEKLGLDSNKLKQDMYTRKSIKKLEEDIRAGLKHTIIGTPSYLVNGEVYVSHLPPELFKDIIDAER